MTEFPPLPANGMQSDEPQSACMVQVPVTPAYGLSFSFPGTVCVGTGQGDGIALAMSPLEKSKSRNIEAVNMVNEIRYFVELKTLRV